MVTENVGPALTPEEWARVREDDIRDNALEKIASGYYFYTSQRNENGVFVPRPDEHHHVALIAYANSLLPDGHPLKITREMVDALLSAAKDSGDEHRAPLRVIAATLSALLPPAR